MCCGAGNGSIDWAEQNPSYLRSNNFMLPASCDCNDDDPKCDNVTFPVFINETHYGDVAQLAWNDVRLSLLLILSLHALLVFVFFKSAFSKLLSCACSPV